MDEKFSQAFPRLADITPSISTEPKDWIQERIRWGLRCVLVLGAPFVALYLWSGVYSLALAHVLASVGCGVLLVALRRVERPQIIGELGISLLFMLLIYSGTISGGFYSSSLTWFLVAPVGAAIVMGHWVAVRWTALAVAITLAFWIDSLTFGFTLQNQIPEADRPVHAIANLVLCITTIGALVWIFVKGHVEAEDRAFVAQKDLIKERQRLSMLARFDSLTTLPNRHSLDHNLARWLESGPVALINLDLNRFRDINDAFGHASGDVMLIEVAQRFAGIVYEGPAPVFSALELYDFHPMLTRRGGDEFTVLMPGATAEEAADLAQRLLLSLTRPFEINAQRLRIAASVGIAMGPRDGATVTRLVRSADIALSRGKALEPGRIEFFESGALEAVQRRVLIETALSDAVEQDEFELYFQPLFSANEELVGAEALLRWESPIVGRIGPDEFIPIAEHSGQMITIGRWVLETACKEALKWDPTTRVSVNISVAQLRSSDLVDSVRDVLRSTGLPPARLELEITESMLADDAHAHRVLVELRGLGVSLALDDFGTGFSSLGVLRSLPVECLKIDRSFVRSMHTDTSDAALVRTIVAMGRELGLRVLAEGVEEREQLHALRSMGCDEIQGYLLGKPMDASAFRALSSRSSRSVEDSTPSQKF